MSAATQKKKPPPKFDFDKEIDETLKWYEEGVRLAKEWAQWDQPVAVGMRRSFVKWLRAFRTEANDVYQLWKLEKKRDESKK